MSRVSGAPATDKSFLISLHNTTLQRTGGGKSKGKGFADQQAAINLHCCFSTHLSTTPAATITQTLTLKQAAAEARARALLTSGTALSRGHPYLLLIPV
jgi:hypothetical protein